MIAPLLALCLAAQGAEHRYAVVVGANEGDPDERPLEHAEQDARAVGAVMSRLGGVNPEDLVLVTDQSADDLRRVLDTLERRLAAEQSEADSSLLLVYYAGHADGAALHLGGSHLGLAELAERVEAMPVDVRVLILDACQVGEALQRRGGTQVPGFDMHVSERMDSEGMAVITSTAAGEDAQESSRLEGGIFSHHLVVGLSGAADADQDERVTLDEAYRYTFARTLASTSKAPVVQHPSYAFDLAGRSDVVLTRLSDEGDSARMRLSEPGSWMVLSEDQTRLVAELEVEQPSVLVVAPGRYRVVRRLPDRVYEGAVQLSAGQQLDSALMGLRVQPLGQAARRGRTSEVHVPLGLELGGGAHGPLLDGQSFAPLAAVGLRAELRWISLGLRARGAMAWADNDILAQQQRAVGAELSALRMVDRGSASLGLGLVGGGSGMWQRFETTGVAPAISGAILHGGPLARAELALHPRVSLGLELGADMVVMPLIQDDLAQIAVRVTPRGGLDATLWLR